MARASKASSSRYPVISPSGRRDRSRQISPSGAGEPVKGSTSTTEYPGNARPIEPSRTGCPGVFPTCAVVSVCPNPSRTVIPQALRTCSITSGLSGSPAATHSRSEDTEAAPRSACSNIRHTVGGAQNVVTAQVPKAESSPAAENRAWFSTRIVAPAFHGAYTLLQACLAHPGEDRFRCTSPGWPPIQYMVARCPAGELAWVCSTSLGCAVVPEVKYSSSGSPARVTPSGTNETGDANASEYECHPGTKPTTIRVQSPASPANLPADPASATTCRTAPRTRRSARSAGCSSVEAGMSTAPSFIAAKMNSHSGATLPSMSST